MKKINKLVIVITVFLSAMLFNNEKVLGQTFIAGVQIEGSDITEPNPEKSKYLETFSGGFMVGGNDAYYKFLVEIINPFDRPMFVKVEFFNPLDKKHPIEYKSELPVKHKTLTLTHGPVKGLRIYRNYWVRVSLYEIENKDEPIDILKQNVRSYVDTTTDIIGFYRGLEIKLE